MKELRKLIKEFGQAMIKASPEAIQRTGQMTPRMRAIWERYREWCGKQTGEAG